MFSTSGSRISLHLFFSMFSVLRVVICVSPSLIILFHLSAYNNQCYNICSAFIKFFLTSHIIIRRQSSLDVPIADLQLRNCTSPSWLSNYLNRESSPPPLSLFARHLHKCLVVFGNCLYSAENSTSRWSWIHLKAYSIPKLQLLWTKKNIVILKIMCGACRNI